MKIEIKPAVWARHNRLDLFVCDNRKKDFNWSKESPLKAHCNLSVGEIRKVSLSVQ